MYKACELKIKDRKNLLTKLDINDSETFFLSLNYSAKIKLNFFPIKFILYPLISETLKEVHKINPLLSFYVLLHLIKKFLASLILNAFLYLYWNNEKLRISVFALR